MRRLAGLAVIAVLLLIGLTITIATKPAQLPSYSQVRDSWQPSYSVLLDRHGQSMGEVRTNFNVRRMNWAEFEQLSPAILKGFVRSEDKRFWQHNGVDWLAIANALISNNNARHKRGGSTITMQLVSLLDTNSKQKRRSIKQKLKQIRSARKLEKHWSKQQVFESWLNHVDFRGEVQGIGAATQLFTGKPTIATTEVEAISLAAMLPAPNVAFSKIRRRACNIATKMDEPVSCELTDKFLNQLAAISSGQDNHQLAYHVKQKLADPAVALIRTTLDKKLQIKAEQILARQLKRLSKRNVRDGAVLVVDNKTGDILAWVGSNLTTSRAKFVDGVTAKRQAGSTLKPHLYAIAIENRLLSAASVLDDSQLQLLSVQGIYAPQNYDRAFVGPVSVRHALGNSLNIPAVKTLKLVGIENFMQQLQNLGYSGIDQSANYYGFALSLGSVEVSLFEQVQAYRSIANGGKFSAINLTSNNDLSEKQILSEQAAFITLDIMADPAARRHTFGRNSVLDLPFIAAVKTGTSKAMRDNWAIGFTSQYTVGVWVGNFEGDAMTGVSGTSGAAPIWNQIMQVLHANHAPEAFDVPYGIVTNKVNFRPKVEADRSEIFLEGLEQTIINIITNDDLAPGIVQPADGTIIALDPDIPPENQLLRIAISGELKDLRLMLNGGTIKPNTLWHPVFGQHELRIEDGQKNIIDQVKFSVR